MTEPRSAGWHLRDVMTWRDVSDRIGLLSPSQREVLELFAMGLTASEIGQRRGVTADAIRYHLTVAYERLGMDGGNIARACYLLGHYHERHGNGVLGE